MVLLPDIGSDVLVSRSVRDSLIDLVLGSTLALELVCLGLSISQAWLSCGTR